MTRRQSSFGQERRPNDSQRSYALLRSSLGHLLWVAKSLKRQIRGQDWRQKRHYKEEIRKHYEGRDSDTYIFSSVESNDPISTGKGGTSSAFNRLNKEIEFVPKEVAKRNAEFE